MHFREFLKRQSSNRFKKALQVIEIEKKELSAILNNTAIYIIFEV